MPGMMLKKVEDWPFTFGGEAHSGWLPPGATVPLPTPVEREQLDVSIEAIDGGYLLVWTARPSLTCREPIPPKAGDTWHATLAEAEDAARDAFGIEQEHWIDCVAP
jgi:hypothetical protein